MEVMMNWKACSFVPYDPHAGPTYYLLHTALQTAAIAVLTMGHLLAKETAVRYS